METRGEKLAEFARSKVGSLYGWGASGPSAFDCSGLIIWAARQLGIKGLPRTSQGMRKAGQVVPLSQIAVGDLVTFTYADRRGDNPGPGNHVAIYAGGGQVVQASGSRVNVAPLDTRHIDRVVRIPAIAQGGIVQAGFSPDGGGGSSTVRQVSTMQQAGYQAAANPGPFGAPVNPFKMPGWIAAGGSAGANTPGGVVQAGLLDGGGGLLGIPWDGLSTVVLSSLFVLGGLALVVGGLAVAVRPSGGVS